jgi:hypothetical protein
MTSLFPCHDFTRQIEKGFEKITRLSRENQIRRSRMKHSAAFALLGTLLWCAGTPAHAAPVVTGGVGDEERAAIERMQKDFSLKLVFTGQRGIFLSDVDVKILDRAGNVVISNVTDGPMLLASLPPGRYVMQASVDGFTQQQNFSVGRSGLRTLHIRFPISDGMDGQLRPSI